MPDCPSCAHECPAGARFCGQCGAALPASCGRCGAPLAAGQRFCQACGAPVAAPTSPAAPPGESDDAAGERRHATILFSDLSGYTALNERLDPEEVSLIMAELRSAATRVVEQHGGIVNQFVGDEIMALFGVPQAGRDDAARAVRAALALHAAADAIGARHAARIGVRLQLHSGINTGLVIVRPCAPHQGRFGLTGDTVNTAARLLGIAAAGEVVAGDDTWRQVAARFEAERLPAVEVRGKALPLQAWRIVRETGDARPAAAMLGRDDELQQARWALQAALGAGGSARLVVIRGEPGIGKSRLLAELQALARTAGAAVVAAAVPDFGPSRAAAAWREWVCGLIGVAPAAEPAERAAAAGQAIGAGLLPVALAPHLYELVDAPLPEALRTSYTALDAAARDRGAFDAVLALLRGRVEPGGLLLTLEDVHWAEPPVLALLARVLAAGRGLRLAVAVTTRPESDAFDAARRAHARDVPALTLDLGPLGDAAADALAARFALAAPDIAARCVVRAGGNPLFLEQLLLSAGEALRDALPGSIQALVLARMDRLAPADKAALQAASVLGQRAESGAWQALLDAPRPSAAEPLVEAGLLRPDDDGMQFAHALIRDGAYESLLKSRRRELHLRAAQWYAGRDAGLRAGHLEHADSPQAAEAYRDAAQAELERLRFEPALALVQRGEARAASDADRRALALLRGQALRELGRNAEALAAFEQARDLASGKDELGRAQAWFEIAAVQRNLSQTDAAWAALDAAQPAAERLGDARWRSRIHYLRGNLRFARGDGPGCEREHAAALALAREAGDALCEAQALSGLGDAHYVAGRMHSARDAFLRCVEACGRAGELRFAVMNRAMAGWCHHWCGDPQASRRELESACDDARALSHRNALAMCEESLALVLTWLGERDAALATSRRAVELTRAVGNKRFEAASLVALAINLRLGGDAAAARAAATEAWDLVQRSGLVAFAGPAALIEVAHNAADAAGRRAALAQAEALLAQGSVAHNHLWLHAGAIRLHLARGDHDAALRHADALEAFVRAEPFVWATQQANAARALVRAARGEAGTALHAELAALHDEARACGLAQSADALAAALAGLAPAAQA